MAVMGRSPRASHTRRAVRPAVTVTFTSASSNCGGTVAGDEEKVKVSVKRKRSEIEGGKGSARMRRGCRKK